MPATERAHDTIKEINVEVKRCPDCGARFGIDAAFCPFDGVALATSIWDRARDPRSSKALMVGERYEVLEALGEGGMGTVYRVRHVVLDRYFAMKVLRRDLANDADLAKRFLQEARATAAVKHPNVVAINDFGEMEDGIPYFVMELLEGETVATRIRARGALPPRAAIKVAKQIAEGLAASHAANVIHRDLKPDNVFLVGRRVGKAAEDEIRIVDFGAAKIIGGSKLTRPGIVFGTPYYMSPEQASGQPIDGRADVYSLGVLLYEMITGRVPFEADTYMGVLTKHMFQAPSKPTPPSGVQLGELENVVMRALQKEPEQRYASMLVFAEALSAALKGRSSLPPQVEVPSAPPVRTVKLPNMSTADRIQHSVDREVRREEQRRRRMIAVGALAAFGTVSLGAALVMLATSSSSTTNAMPPPVSITPPKALPTATASATASAIATAVVSAPSPAASEPDETPVSSSAATTSSPPSTVSNKKIAAPVGSPRRSPPPTTAPPTSQSMGNTSAGAGNRRGNEDFPDPWKR